VAQSYDRNTTKGGHADRIPIAAELVPYLQRAIAASPSELVFPNPDGSMMREDVDLVGVLRRAMGRAGIVIGYQHVCRRKGCQYSMKVSLIRRDEVAPLDESFEYWTTLRNDAQPHLRGADRGPHRN
jgi:hypothetical protein